jgi:hypothetical protein
MKNEKTYQIIIGILVIIILGGGWITMVKKDSSADDTSETATTTEQSTGTNEMSNVPSSTGSTMVQTGESVSVADQAAGSSIVVATLSLEQASWVAVRDANGHILGAGWFPAGDHQAVSVPLLRSTVAGDHYQAMLYADDGDKKFDFHVDSMITNSDGSVAGTTFIAQ